MNWETLCAPHGASLTVKLWLLRRASRAAQHAWARKIRHAGPITPELLKEHGISIGIWNKDMIWTIGADLASGQDKTHMTPVRRVPRY